MCKGLKNLCFDNSIFIYSSTKQHKHHVLYLDGNFLFNNIQVCKRSTTYTDAVLSNILDIEGGYAVLNIDMSYKTIWWKNKPKQKMQWQAQMQNFFLYEGSKVKVYFFLTFSRENVVRIIENEQMCKFSFSTFWFHMMWFAVTSN